MVSVRFRPTLRRLRAFALLWAALMGFLGVLSARADFSTDTRISLEVRPSSGTVDDTFSFSVKVQGTGGGGGIPMLVGGNDFRLTLVGSSVEMVGGLADQQFQTTYEYQLLPKKAGTLLTPSAELEVDGRKLSAEAKRVEVLPSKNVGGNRSAELFLSQTVDRSELFVGEQALTSLELYSTRELFRPQFVDLTYDDFWVEQLPQEDPFARNLDGVRYQVLRSRRAIFPLHAGELLLPPRTVKTGVIVQQRVRYPALGGIFNFESIERVPEDRRVESNELRLRIKELPKLPPSYSSWGLIQPIVGATNLSGALDRSALKTGETATLTLSLESEGNISGLREVPLPSSETLRTYQDTPERSVSEIGGKLWTKIIFHISVVPLRPGTIALPSLALSYFDPRSGRFEMAKLSAPSLSVSGDALSADKSGTGSDAQRPEATGGSSKAGDIPNAVEKAPTPTEELLPEGLTQKLFSVVSGGTLLMVCLALLALIGWGWLMARERQEPQLWSGTSDELVAETLRILSLRYGVPEGAPLEGFRAGVRRGERDPGYQFELCAVLDQLEGCAGKPSEALIKHLEALIPFLRSHPGPEKSQD